MLEQSGLVPWPLFQPQLAGKKNASGNAGQINSVKEDKENYE